MELKKTHKNVDKVKQMLYQCELTEIIHTHNNTPPQHPPPAKGICHCKTILDRDHRERWENLVNAVFTQHLTINS